MLTSGAGETIELRGAYDAANLVSLFSAAPDVGRKMISANAQSLMRRAETKRSVKGALTVQNPKLLLPKHLQMLLNVPEFKVEIETIKSWFFKPQIDRWVYKNC